MHVPQNLLAVVSGSCWWFIGTRVEKGRQRTREREIERKKMEKKRDQKEEKTGKERPSFLGGGAVPRWPSGAPAPVTVTPGDCSGKGKGRGSDHI